VGNSPRNINSGFNSEILNDSQHKSNTRSVLDGNVGSLDGKLQIRNEIRKKERLLDVRMKQKMALQKNKLGSELEKQYEEMKKDLLARNEYERLELSRQKANFNIGRKKLKDE
jgi:phenylalanyl-tRNA synthetase alpha subunit